MHRCLSKGILTILLLLAVGLVYAVDSANDEAIETDTDQPSNMESWQEGWQTDKKKDGWTWFGMGYESRRGSFGSQEGKSSGGSLKGQNRNGVRQGGGNKR
ncbi:MAG: hypothetical protein PVI97_07615 [Candidatus Thiodiazotropha sp.]|jgi:hypothetical protein